MLRTGGEDLAICRIDLAVGYAMTAVFGLALIVVFAWRGFDRAIMLVPAWALAPMVLLATVATIIASQAIITGSFSLTSQAIQLGYLPRLRVLHTSASHIGQIYVAPVNWLLMVCSMGLVVGFQSSSKLAAAYGMAVTSTMLITTTLFFEVARHKWEWNRLQSVALTGVFFLIDIPFFSANVSKIFHGAWFPLAIGAMFFIMMLTAFLALVKPASTMAKPACMKNTRAAATSVQT